MDNRHKVVVGIDLGTTNSSLALGFPNGTVQVTTDRDGKHKYIPSVVFFPRKDNNILVGHVAAKIKSNGSTSLGKVIFDTKRLIGQPYSENELSPVQKWRNVVNAPVRNIGGRPVIECQLNGQTVLQRPEDIAAKILKKLIENAEQQLNTRSSDCPIRLTKAVVCVPAHFTNAQKAQTKEGAMAAGLTDVIFLPEPTAAVYSYGFREHDYDNVNILVYDFGGGTFDVAIMSIVDRVFKVIEKGGLMNFGGRDLDHALYNYCNGLIKERFGIDCDKDKKKASKLWNECEEKKEYFSEANEISIDLEDFLQIEEELVITLEKFEELIEPHIANTIRVTMETLAKAGLEIEQIDQVLLVGGSSRIKLVEKKLKEEGFSHVNKSSDPELSIAHGAAVYAGLSFGEMKSQMPMKLIETTTFSLGIRSDFNQFLKIIDRNTPIPCKKTRVYSTSINDQQTMRFEVFEGERPLASLNNFIGTLSIDGIGAGVAGSKKVNLTIEVDNNGTLAVYAKHGDVEKKMDFEYKPEAEISEEQIEEMVRHEEEDRAEARRLQAMSTLQLLIEQKKYKSESPQILNLCENFALWMEANEDAELETLLQKIEQFKREAQ